MIFELLYIIYFSAWLLHWCRYCCIYTLQAAGAKSGTPTEGRDGGAGCMQWIENDNSGLVGRVR